MMNQRRKEGKRNVQLSWALYETLEEAVYKSNEVKHQLTKRVDIVSV